MTARPRFDRRDFGRIALVLSSLGPFAVPALVLGLFAGGVDSARVLYMARNANAAAREGARQLESTAASADLAACPDPSRREPHWAEGPGGAAARYLRQVGLEDAATVTVSCLPGRTGAHWSVHVRLAYHPLLGALPALLNGGGGGPSPAHVDGRASLLAGS